MNATNRHRCRASGCLQMVAPELLMCPAHWRMVPPNIQAEVHSAYHAVTRTDASVSKIKAYTDAVNKAVEHVSALEFKRTTATAASLLKDEVAA